MVTNVLPYINIFIVNKIVHNEVYYIYKLQMKIEKAQETHFICFCSVFIF